MMNEKIKHFAEQAGFYYTPQTGFITPAGCDPAKFAELIVMECAKHAARKLYDWEGYTFGIELELKNHFGVGNVN